MRDGFAGRDVHEDERVYGENDGGGCGGGCVLHSAHELDGARDGCLAVRGGGVDREVLVQHDKDVAEPVRVGLWGLPGRCALTGVDAVRIDEVSSGAAVEFEPTVAGQAENGVGNLPEDERRARARWAAVADGVPEVFRKLADKLQLQSVPSRPALAGWGHECLFRRGGERLEKFQKNRVRLRDAIEVCGPVLGRERLNQQCSIGYLVLTEQMPRDPVKSGILRMYHARTGRVIAIFVDTEYVQVEVDNVHPINVARGKWTCTGRLHCKAPVTGSTVGIFALEELGVFFRSFVPLDFPQLPSCAVSVSTSVSGAVKRVDAHLQGPGGAWGCQQQLLGRDWRDRHPGGGM